MNEKLSVFVIFVEVVTCLLLYNSHGCIVKVENVHVNSNKHNICRKSRLVKNGRVRLVKTKFMID